jgi:NADH dehydrogenase
MHTRDLVTGAFGYTGSRIAERLLARGRQVHTLTRRSPGNHPLAGRVDVRPYDFDADALERTLAGVDTLFVTYWMRFARGDATWVKLVANVARLAQAATATGVRRIVYISVSNAGHGAPTAYFRAKAAAEDAIRSATRGSASTSHAIVRPTLLYGSDDILINNMAWALRRLPVFGIPGDGRYWVQPVHVDDVADLVVELAARDDNVETDAAGPERLTFNEIVATVRAAVHSRAVIVHLPPPLVLASTRVIGTFMRDVILTGDEIRELMQSLLVSTGPATSPTRFTDWISAHAGEIGRHYSSELGRNFRFERSP